MMNRHARERRIVELKAQDLPALTWLDIFTPAEGSEPPTEAQQSVLDAYFARFVAAPKDADGHTLCICCQKRMLDGLMGLLGGLSDDTTTIEWGLAHGEAHCRACGWPSRVYHYDIGGTGDEALIKRLNLALQVHPSQIELREAVGA